VKQTVSAPVALIAIMLCAGLGIVLFGRPEPETIDPADFFVLPFAPPVEEAEQSALRKSLFPLGVAVVFPPLPADRAAGARIALVASGSPAANGGVKPGDLVLSFNGFETRHPYALGAAVALADPEKPSEITIERAGEEQTLVIVGIRPLPSKEQLF